MMISKRDWDIAWRRETAKNACFAAKSSWNQGYAGSLFSSQRRTDRRAIPAIAIKRNPISIAVIAKMALSIT
jgi:hypothetical protein